MSEWPTTGNTPREIPGLDETVPPEERDARISSDEGDYLPETPPDMMPRGTEWGTAPGEERSEETIDQRIAQEEPDPDSAYGAPDNESGLDDPDEFVGGDDPDAITPTTTFSETAVANRPTTRSTAPPRRPQCTSRARWHSTTAEGPGRSDPCGSIAVIRVSVVCFRSSVAICV